MNTLTIWFIYAIACATVPSCTRSRLILHNAMHTVHLQNTYICTVCHKHQKIFFSIVLAFYVELDAVISITEGIEPCQVGSWYFSHSGDWNSVKTGSQTKANSLCRYS